MTSFYGKQLMHIYIVYKATYEHEHMKYAAHTSHTINIKIKSISSNQLYIYRELNWEILFMFSIFCYIKYTLLYFQYVSI